MRRTGTPRDSHRNRSAFRALALAAITVGLAVACTSPPAPQATVTVNVTPSTTATTTAPTPAATPQPTATVKAPLGWPRAGWTKQSEDLGTITAYFPNSWTFDSNLGYWGDGTIRTFCDAFVDPALQQAGAPDAKTLAEKRWNLTFGPGAVTNEHGFTTFFGGEAWGADVTLGDGTTVEPRIYVIFGDVWIHCGAITRGTSATGAEIWDIVDSIQIVDQSAMTTKSWMAIP